MTKVFFQGSFDMFHWMHLESIKRAKAEGDYLIVGVNSDEFIEKYKGKLPVFPYKYRAEIIRSLRYVDEVRKMDDTCSAAFLNKSIDVYVTGEEWVESEKHLHKCMQDKGGRVAILPYTKVELMADIERRMRAKLEKKLSNSLDDYHKKIKASL